ncbi:SpoIID/LytB domain-containing protein [Acidithrix sp. C25]|uniref:SpoIID/LytB domain-containing protein n=1 Tax=Acidithrix sp. C25 TaxID=1671482 RepID=UPI00191BB483|nr:SpoIID/LytB domain-containing protein [Acidithrix sp. C25]
MNYQGGSLRYYKKPSRLAMMRRPTVIATAAVAGLSPGSVFFLTPIAAGASTPPSSGSSIITFSGHGWGHGRGAGQWGQLGYALQGGLNANQILAHYYSNTTPSVVQNTPIRVIITANSGNDIVVTDSSPFTVGGFAFAANAQARMHLNANGTWEIDSTTATSCSPTTSWTALSSSTPQAQAVASPNTTNYATETTQNALALCIGGVPYNYRGTIDGASYNGSERTINVVDVEDYLRGVVGSESPAYWGTLGNVVNTNTPAGSQPTGMYALMAQAIEARSYALSSPNEFGYADICDNTYCQVYRGMAGESSYTDTAVSATAGQVLMLNGAIARTEFSSSTGGYTAGGTFPAVVDTYDGICTSSACNTNHSWNANLTISQLQSDFPTLGTLSAITVDQRNGYGDYGGRVVNITVTGSSGSQTMSGEQFSWDTGLRSDWFTFSGSGIALSTNGSLATTTTTPTTIPQPPATPGYYVDSSQGGVVALGSASVFGSMVGTKLNKPVVGMAATPDGKGYWMVAADGGIFSFGDAAFYGSTGAIKLNKPIVGMSSTPDGKGYWLVASDGGIFTFGDAAFYGSTGAMKLNKPIVGMASTPDGKGYWLVASDGGIFTFGDAAFYGSTGAMNITSPIVGMASTPDGKGYWLVSSNGSIYCFGDAANMGSIASNGYGGSAVSMAAAPQGGYYILSSSGKIYAFGPAPIIQNAYVNIGTIPGSIVGIAAI